MSVILASLVTVPAVVAALVLGGVANGAFAQETTPAAAPKTAGIYAGACDAVGGDAVFALNEVKLQDDDGRAPSGDPVGIPSAAGVEISDTQLNNLRVEDLFAQPHSVVVAAADGTTVACGEIGGYLYENEDLYVGLRQQNDSGAAGVAIIEGDDDDDDDEVDVNLYLVPDAAAPAVS